MIFQQKARAFLLFSLVTICSAGLTVKAVRASYHGDVGTPPADGTLSYTADFSRGTARWHAYAHGRTPFGDPYDGLTSTPLDAALASGERTEVSFNLPDDPRQWTSLGANERLGCSYGCAPLADVLPRMHHDYGFILYPLSARGPGGTAVVDSTRLPAGRIGIDRVSIRYRHARDTAAARGRAPRNDADAELR